MKITINPQQYEELIKRSYNLDIIYLLKLLEEQYDITPLYKNNMKISSIYQSLIRKGLITETDNKITILGKDLITFVELKETVKLIRRRPATTDFEEWWKTYPGTDSFDYKGKKFTGTRSIRKGKDACRLKFDKILLEGEYTAIQLLAALNYELLQKKESSIDTNTNKITFMQNSITYLNQGSYEAYIELINDGVTVKLTSEKSTGGTSI